MNNQYTIVKMVDVNCTLTLFHWKSCVFDRSLSLCKIIDVITPSWMVCVGCKLYLCRNQVKWAPFISNTVHTPTRICYSISRSSGSISGTLCTMQSLMPHPRNKPNDNVKERGWNMDLYKVTFLLMIFEQVLCVGNQFPYLTLCDTALLHKSLSLQHSILKFPNKSLAAFFKASQVPL